MTLTCNPHNYETPDEAARDMKRALVHLRRRIERRYGVKKLPFIVVYEATKRGWPHMHILCRAPWMDQKWLSDCMKELINAPIMDVRKIQDTGRAAAYVCKYIGKCLHNFKGCKRWWRSHNYEIEKEEPLPKVQFGLRWEVILRPFQEYIADVLRFDYEVVAERNGYCHFRKRGPP